MRGQIGNWGDCLDVGLTPEMVAHFDQFGVDRHLSLSVLIVEQQYEDGLVRRTRTVTLRPDRSAGQKVFAGNDTMAMGHHVRFHNCTNGENLALLQAPRFRLHEVTFSEPLFGEGELCATLDHDHLLPWPKLSDCKLYDCAEVLQRDLSKRLRSALLHGSKTMGAPMPDSLRDRMVPGTYKNALAEARASLEAEKAAAMESALAA